MKNQVYLSKPSPRNQVTQALLNEQWIDKAQVSIHRAFSLLKSSQHLEQTSGHQICHFHRKEENSFSCMECDRKLSLNDRGEIDKDQLSHEIASRQWCW